MNAARFNRHIDDGRARAEANLAALERAYHLTLTLAGRHASDRFEALTVDHLVADATDPKWTPPENDQLLDPDAMAADAQKRTKVTHRASLKTVIGPVLADVGIAYDVSNPLISGLIDKLGVRAEDMGAAVRGDVAAAVLDSYQQGLSVPDAAAAIRAKVEEIAPARAAMLARTDLVGLANGASMAAAQIVSGADAGGEGALGYKSWLATEDERTRESHADADGQIVPLDQGFDVGGEQLAYPGDPDGSDEEVCNCFPMGTKVEFPGLRAVMRRRYEGDLIRIRLSSGNELSGTPNHPVLRSDGQWIALGDLQKGDHLVCASGIGQAVGAPDPDCPPSEIGEIYSLACVSAEPHRISLAPPDLHGNGMHGEVDVVAVDGSLLVDGEAATDEQVAEFGLAIADLARARERGRISCVGVSETGVTTAPTGRIGGESETSALVISEPLHAENVRLGAGTGGEVQFIKAPGDHATTYAERLTHGENALPSRVALAEIVEVNRSAFHGDVGDIDTGHGWYISGGVIAKNCRCTVTYLDAAEAAGETGDSDLAMAASGESPTDAVASQGHMDASPLDTTAAVTITVDDEAAEQAAPQAPLRWRAILAIEGRETQDNATLTRMLAVGETTWRDLPIPLGVMYETPHSDEVKAEVCGLIDTIYRDDTDFRIIWGEGAFNADAVGQRAAEMIGNLSLRGVSIDPYVPEVEIFDTPAESDNGVGHSLIVMKGAVIMAATVCPVQAIDGAQITLVASSENPDVMPYLSETCFVLTRTETAGVPVVAAAADAERGSLSASLAASAASLDVARATAAAQEELVAAVAAIAKRSESSNAAFVALVTDLRAEVAALHADRASDRAALEARAEQQGRTSDQLERVAVLLERQESRADALAASVAGDVAAVRDALDVRTELLTARLSAIAVGQQQPPRSVRIERDENGRIVGANEN